MTNRTSCLALVLLHMRTEAGALGVSLPTDLARDWTVCEREQGLLEDFFSHFSVYLHIVDSLFHPPVKQAAPINGTHRKNIRDPLRHFPTSYAMNIPVSETVPNHLAQ